MAWCIAANGEKVRVELDTLMGADNQSISLYKAAEIELTEPGGKKWRILVNPEKLLVPGHSEWNGKDFILL